MSERFPPISPDETQSIGIDFENYIRRQHGSTPNFRYKDSNGALLGPFAVAAYTPDIAVPFMEIGDAVLTQTGLDPRSRELAILAVCSVYSTPFIQYAHCRIASQFGLTDAQIKDACSGTTPAGLNDEAERVVYEMSLELASSKGPLSGESWARAEKVLGREKAARVGHTVGFYLYAGSIMRLGNIMPPET